MANRPEFDRRRRLMLAGGMFMAMGSAAVGAELLRPTRRLADLKPPVRLAVQVPEVFGEWRVDHSLVPVLPSPELEASLDKLYSETLARAYVNPRGERVLLSIAYGSDQGSEATSVHRPEFCYSAQGFQVKVLRDEQVALGRSKLMVKRLLGTQGRRYEPITYWITLDEIATLPGLGRKLAQIEYGLRGEIPDGLLFRLSTIGLDEVRAFALQDRFAQELYAAMEEAIRPRYFGS
jgi:EpsI family protein